MNQPLVEQLPAFLQTYEDLNSYIRDTFDDFDNTAKGSAFARFVGKIIPLSNLGEFFTDVEKGPDSRDGGVDLTSTSHDGARVLYGQSKLTIKEVDEIDRIISKFKDYHERVHAQKVKQMPLLIESIEKSSSKPTQGKNKKTISISETTSDIPQEVHFVILTLSKIKNRILPEYEKSRLASKEYYNDLKQQGRITIMDGPEILPLVQSAYRKLHIIPSNIDVNFVTDIIRHDNVYIGVMSANELKRCYKECGDALFLENIRLFLGFSVNTGEGENVNDSIRDTAEKSPHEMLARNNGITFRASKVDLTDRTHLHIEQASIVNGCQTTMCIVQSSSTDACVLVKIVEVADSWAIAKAANYQNTVKQIALDVARYMRPQSLQQAASKAGILVEDKNESLYDIFDSIYKERVRYDEAFHLFLGLFSRNPMNVINKAYGELRNDVLEQLQLSDPTGETIFEFLFKLYKHSNEGRKLAEERYQGESYRVVFQRFWKENKSDYRSIVTILAACGCVRQNIYTAGITAKTIQDFTNDMMSLLTNDPEKFIRHYCYAYEAILSYLRIKNAGKDDKDIQRTMYDDLRGADFDTLYDLLCMNTDGREPELK